MSDGRLKEARRRAAGVAAVPPSGQVVSSNAATPPAQVISDAEFERQYERKLNGRTLFLMLILSNLAAGAIGEAGWMRLAPAYLACCGAASLVEYWVPPRPPWSFLSHALRMAGVLINLYVGLVTLPESLRNSLPAPLAYGLPAFVVFLMLYWAPPLYPIGKRATFWKWVMMSAAGAAWWAWVGAY
ncbi:MAG TPA: hypothetical protein VM936_13905 [Pyrinomonadaceae bacterium]|nr:hypothetical protein [Pyrinomonadaceae bacterium]